MLPNSYDSVVDSSICFADTCWGIFQLVTQRNWPNWLCAGDYLLSLLWKEECHKHCWTQWTTLNTLYTAQWWNNGVCPVRGFLTSTATNVAFTRVTKQKWEERHDWGKRKEKRIIQVMSRGTVGCLNMSPSCYCLKSFSISSLLGVNDTESHICAW